MQNNETINISVGTAADIDLIAQFQVDMALESEGTTLDHERVVKGVTAAMEDQYKGTYIVAKDGEYLVFVEVKYRSSGRSGSPLEAVDSRKQRIISKVASYYCLTHGYGEASPCRFDVVAIKGEEYTLIKNAFEYVGW